MNVRWLPVNGLFRTLNIIPKSMQTNIYYIFPSIIFGFCYVFAISLYKHVTKGKQTMWDMFLLTTTVLIMLTTVKSSAHFASKYILQSYIFFLIYISADIRINKYLVLRMCIGTLIGILSISSVFIIHNKFY